MQAVGSLGECSGGIAPAYKNRRQHIAFGCHGGLHREYGRQGLDIADDLARCAARLHHRVGQHQPYHLANMLDFILRKHRLVLAEAGEQPVARNVAGKNHGAYAWHGKRCRAVNAQQPAVRHA